MSADASRFFSQSSAGFLASHTGGPGAGARKSAGKEADARRFGARDCAPTAALSDGRFKAEFDFILSTANADLDWAGVLRALRPKGTLCFVGIAPKPAAFVVNDFITAERHVTGNPTGNRRQMREMLHFAALHGVRPQVETLPLARANDALARVARNVARYRVVLQAARAETR